MPKLDNRDYSLLQNFIDCAPCAAAIVRVHLNDDPKDFPSIELVYDKKKGQYVVKTRHLPAEKTKEAKTIVDHFMFIHDIGRKFMGLAEVSLWMPVPKLLRRKKKP